MMPAVAEKPRNPDPLRVLTIGTVSERTGFSPRTITRWLAQDRIDGTPNKRFPEPHNNPASGRMQWREVKLVEWMEKQEQQ